MSGRRIKNPWIFLGQVKPAWGERYADRAADWRFVDDTDVSGTTMESEWEDFSPEEKNPFDPSGDDDDDDDDDYDEWSFSAHSSHVDLLPSPSVPFSSPASPWSPPLRAPWTRYSQTRTRYNWRRTRRAAASHPYKASGYRHFRAPVSRRPRCGGGCCNCDQRRYRPRGYKPNLTSWEHLPAVIQPTKWYQVVGSMQCSHCSDQGRHQMTSWICQSCQVPLCLMPYRNCYAKWHGHSC